MDFKYLFLSGQGRINRHPYWIASIILAVIDIIIGIVIGFTDILALNIISLILVWPTIMLGIKRCHDRDRSGWFLLVALIPIVNIWVIIDLLFLRGTDGSNRFGEDPLAKA